jgi:hypothetical protein
MARAVTNCWKGDHEDCLCKTEVNIRKPWRRWHHPVTNDAEEPGAMLMIEALIVESGFHYHTVDANVLAQRSACA